MENRNPNKNICGKFIVCKPKDAEFNFYNFRWHEPDFPGLSVEGLQGAKAIDQKRTEVFEETEEKKFSL